MNARAPRGRHFGPLDTLDRLEPGAVLLSGAGAAPPPHVYRWTHDEIPPAGAPWPAQPVDLVAYLKSKGALAVWWTDGPAFRALDLAPGADVDLWPSEYPNGADLTPIYATRAVHSADGFVDFATPPGPLAYTHDSLPRNSAAGPGVVAIAGVEFPRQETASSSIITVAQDEIPGVLEPVYVATYLNGTGAIQGYSSVRGSGLIYTSSYQLAPRYPIRGTVICNTPTPGAAGTPFGWSFDDMDVGLANRVGSMPADAVAYESPRVGFGGTGADPAVRVRFTALMPTDVTTRADWPEIKAVLDAELTRPVLDVPQAAGRANVTRWVEPVTGRPMCYGNGGPDAWLTWLAGAVTPQPCSYSIVARIGDAVIPTGSPVLLDSGAVAVRNIIFSASGDTDYSIYANVKLNSLSIMTPGDLVAVVARMDGANSRIVVQGRTAAYAAVTGNAGTDGIDGARLLCWAGGVPGDLGTEGAIGDLVYAPGHRWSNDEMDRELARQLAAWEI